MSLDVHSLQYYYNLHSRSMRYARGPEIQVHFGFYVTKPAKTAHASHRGCYSVAEVVPVGT